MSRVKVRRTTYNYKNGKMESSSEVFVEVEEYLVRSNSFEDGITKMIRDQGFSYGNSVRTIGGLEARVHVRERPSNNKSTFAPYTLLVDIASVYLIKFSDLPSFLDFARENLEAPSFQITVSEVPEKFLDSLWHLADVIDRQNG
jgi:hypothetical protein